MRNSLTRGPAAARQVVVWGYDKAEAELHRDEAAQCLQIKPGNIVVLVGHQEPHRLCRYRGKVRSFGHIPQWMRRPLGLPLHTF